jgi:hypothetical protein
MHISGNGDLYDDEEIFGVSSKQTVDYSNEMGDDFDFPHMYVEDVIVSWEMRLDRLM